MKITFNTGRLYQPEGQVITAEDQGNLVLFMDHSRGIAGEIPEIYPDWMSRSASTFSRWVMERYDKGQYQMSADAMELERLDTVFNVRI